MQEQDSPWSPATTWSGRPTDGGSQRSAWKHVACVRCSRRWSLGELHRGRRRIQPAGRVVREFYDAARDVLKYPLLN